ALDPDLLADGLHRYPRAVEQRLVRVGGIRLLDVRVDFVDPSEGDAPRHILVVAEIDAHKRRLTAANYVPSWRVQVDEIAQRGHFDRTMRIVRDDRETARRQFATHDPVVAAIWILQLRHQPRGLRRWHERTIRFQDFGRGELPRRERIVIAF